MNRDVLVRKHQYASDHDTPESATVQLAAPPLPPGFVPPPSGFLEFVTIYVVFMEIVLLALPRKISNRILEVLFPILRYPL